LPSLSQSPVPTNGAPASTNEPLPAAPVTLSSGVTSSGSSSHQPPPQSLPAATNSVASTVHPHPPVTHQATPVQTFFPSPVSATVNFDSRLSGNTSSHSNVAAASVQGHTINMTTAPVKSSEDSRESLEALFPVSGK
jgi:hypothetical protein